MLVLVMMPLKSLVILLLIRSLLIHTCHYTALVGRFGLMVDTMLKFSMVSPSSIVRVDKCIPLQRLDEGSIETSYILQMNLYNNKRLAPFSPHVVPSESKLGGCNGNEVC